MKQTQWSVNAAVTQLAASTLVSVARDLGAPMPKGVAVDGHVVGRIGFASISGLQGEFGVTDGIVQLQDGPQLKLAEASLFIAGDTFRFAPGRPGR